MPNLFAGLAGSPEETVDTPYFFLCTESASAPEEVVLGTVEACVVVYPDQVVISGKSQTLRKLLVQSLEQTAFLPGTSGISSQARYLNEWSFVAPDAKLRVARRLSLLQDAGRASPDRQGGRADQQLAGRRPRGARRLH